jgi:hypothetical protein
MQPIPAMIELKKEHFQPLVGRLLRVESQMGHIDLRLVKITAYPHYTLPNAMRETFSLLLCDDHGRVIPSLGYTLHHPQFGALNGVLVTPVMPPPEYIQPGQIGGPTFYEICFN